MTPSPERRRRGPPSSWIQHEATDPSVAPSWHTDNYLEDGKLYAARFNADGTGTWLELKFGAGTVTAANAAYAFADQADVLINPRLAADAAGATKMDRPQWGAVDPVTGAVYMTLANSNAASRTLASTDAANPRHYNDVMGTSTKQFGNPSGHIIR